VNTVDALINLGRLSLAFGCVNRITYHPDGITPESDTDHTVMLGLAACALADGTGLDVGLVAQYALVHDLVEVYAGDTATLRALPEREKASKREREEEAFWRIEREFTALPWLAQTIAAYEGLTSPEARFVKALDKLLPKITHILNGCVTLREQGMSVADMKARYALQVEELKVYAADFPTIFELRADLVDRVMALYAGTQVAS
jgi:5'-deoxynucleotidase YfbR-like HD superfamily hydrolase